MKLYIFILKVLRKTHRRIISKKRDVSVDYSNQDASDYLKKILLGDKPVMISRFGSVELGAILNYQAIVNKNSLIKSSFCYITGEKGAFWWENSTKYSMQNNAGFFPADDKHLKQYAKQVLNEMQYVDVLGSWLSGENDIKNHLIQAKTVKLKDLEPYYHTNPWSSVLKGKKVLVIHPFASTIEKQYKKRHLLFKNKDVLPDFELITYKAIQSIAFEKTNFDNWFDALYYMCDSIDKIDYDIAIIGAGAYGFSLAAHIKKSGKKAIHLGGATQILFGIKGKRWEDVSFFKELFNNHWVRAGNDEKPINSNDVESNCYW